ncbi:MAG: rod shape-determining protein RodA [Deltaproteobacteria bacterium CG_4_10_14_3_um_filter_60_8]|nr:MAG: rod shape-determining protein RodA [Deltaproteobacteria bacterium CG_4_10_14_3_um_filter_60_8]
MWRFDRRLLLNFDWVLLGTVLVIGAMGLLNLYSATFMAASYGTPLYLKQVYFFVGGLLLILAIISIDYRRLITWNYPLYGAGLLLLGAALLLGRTVGGSQRWIPLGFFNLQPSEPAKVILVITLASYYYRKDTGKGFTLRELAVPVLLTLAPFLLIMKQPDLGTALMLGFVFVSMTLFVKLKWLTLGVLLTFCITTVPVGWMYFLKPYQKQRIETFLNPEGDPRNAGYHIIQSKIAVGSGMKLGKGYLKGTQGHLDFLPERHTDFAFSVWAEEWGFVGSIFFVATYFFLILWGMNVVTSSRDKFGAILAFGIISLIFWQAFINLAMVLGLLPVVGMPLPLFSYGGSSLFATLVGIGILMNIRMRRYLAPM